MGNKQHETDGGVISHDGIPTPVGFRKTQDEVDDPAQAAKDDPVKLAASSTRQNKCGKRREKGQDNNQESRQEGKNMQERHIGEHGRNYIME